ncbi:MAG: helix-turn-helix transcriptional regulator [Clostridia bacterium]|nr:helix-turn-helix transcriptional regulator [Clostridia bacterium]
MPFNAKLKQLRLSKLPPITQTDLANVLGMTQRKISFLETGVTEPSLRDLRAICLYFNVSCDYLLDLPDNLTYEESND